MLDKAAEEGARRALAAVGLHDEDAADDVRDIRKMMEDWRAMKRSILSSLGNAVVLSILALIGTGIWWHFNKAPPPR